MKVNPFADYGKIVHGDRFVGRKKETRLLRTRTLQSSFGNCAIQGLPRIGKSSLAWNTFMIDAQSMIRNRVIPIWVEMGSVNSSKDFLDLVFNNLHRQILRCDLIDKSTLQKLYSNIQSSVRSIVRNEEMKIYLQEIRSRRLKVIFVLDEFDSVRTYFSSSDFQLLREFSYNPYSQVCIVTVSRRSLKEIELTAGSLSNFFQTFDEINLGMFSEKDLKSYWTLAERNGLNIGNDIRKRAVALAGHHPFLLDLFNYNIVEGLNHSSESLSQDVEDKIFLSLVNHYENIIRVLRDEGLDRKLIQVIEGPIYDLTISDVEKLERYDVIYRLPKGVSCSAQEAEYSVFSESFGNYLKTVRRQTPIWPLLSKTEIKLREVVHAWAVDRYGQDWVKRYRKTQNKEDFVKELERRRSHQQNLFPETYSKSLLDYTYPLDLFSRFMCVEWSWFQKILGKSTNDWKNKFELFARVRTPLAHSKENILKDHDRDLVTGVCKEVLSLIEKWEETIEFQS